MVVQKFIINRWGQPSDTRWVPYIMILPIVLQLKINLQTDTNIVRAELGRTLDIR